MEDYAVVLDFMPYGKSTDMKREPTAQIVGETYFTLLEVILRQGVQLKPGERVYIGKDERPQVEYIKGRISYFDLTASAKSELRGVLRQVITSREQEFVAFFNKAGGVTIRLHQIELLPGIGKKYLLSILNEREKKPFENFAEMRKRIPLLPDPVEIVGDEITNELQGGTKYYLFTKPPAR
jgi:putative nucleotide binding protein